MPALSKQQQKTLNKEYQNWLAVIQALSVMCDGIRPYIEREMKAFHQALLVKLAGVPPCACTRLPTHETRGANPCRWAVELKMRHRGGRPKWQQSDSTKWTYPDVGYCEVAKIFMSDLGTRAPHVDINNSDTTGLINLLYWCDHFTTPQHLVHAVRQTRNTWGHSSSLRLSDAERNGGFQSIRDLLQDPVLATDPGILNVLAEINNLTKDLTVQDIERRLLLEALNDNEEVLKECREQLQKEKNEWKKKRPTMRLQKRLSSLEKSLKKESQKRAEIEKRLQRTEEAVDVKKKQPVMKGNITDGMQEMLIKQVKSSRRFFQKLMFVLAFLTFFVLLDPTSYEDGELLF